MKRVAFHTLGCKTNQYDTQAMRERFIAAGWTEVDFEAEAEVYVVNTCTVTNVSDRKSRQMIRRAARNGLVVAAGCLAQRDPAALAELEGVGVVLGTADRGAVVELTERALAGERVQRVTPNLSHRQFEELTIAESGPLARANLKIQEGCNRYCSYCAIPLVRGPARSRPLASVAEEARRLRRSGCWEIVLTGIHLESYGCDLEGVTLLDAAAAVLETGARVRLGSLEPMLVTDEFLERLGALPGLCPQFHLSLQSGSAAVLARMNRRYGPEEYAEAVRKLRARVPGCAITTDVMAGFPGETEAEHRENLAFLQQIGFARAHVFPYSPRPGTRAAGMPGQLSRALREARARELIAAAQPAARAFLWSQQGRIQEILVEGEEQGTTAHSLTARVNGPAQPGRLVRALCIGVTEQQLLCQQIKEA